MPARTVMVTLAGVAAAAGVIGAHLALAAPMRVPIIHPDELGYLLNARFLALGGARAQTEYYPGFSLLVAPLWLVSAVPAVVYAHTLMVEAALSGLGAVLTWRLIPYLAPLLVGWRRAATTAVVCAYPSFLLYSDLALAEIAFVTVFAAVVVVAAHALGGRSPRWWGALGVTSGLLVAVHPRGLAVVVAVVALGVLALSVRRSSAAPLGALGTGLAASLAAGRALVSYTTGPASRFGAYAPDSVLAKSLSLHGAGSLLVELSGQMFYLSVASVGLVPLALLAGGRSLWRVLRGARAPVVLLQAFATLSFAGVWALSSLFMNLGERADKLLYGRYTEGVVVPLLVLALADLLGPGTAGAAEGRRALLAGRRWLVLGVTTVVVSGVVAARFNTAAALRGPLNPVNVLGLAPVTSRMAQHLDMVALVAAGAGCIAVLALISWRAPALAVGLLGILFVASALDTQTRYLVPGSRARANQDAIARALTAIRAAGVADLRCVGYDPAPLGFGDYTFYEDQFLDPEQSFGLFDSSTGAPPCGSLAVSRRPDFATRHPEARLVTSEGYLDQSLWALPRAGDPTFGALAAGGWLSPLGTASAPLPAAALDAGSVHLDTPVRTVVGGKAIPVSVVATHGPGGAPWPAVTALHSGSGAYGVRLVVTWSRAGAPRRATPRSSTTAVPISVPPQSGQPGQAATREADTREVSVAPTPTTCTTDPGEATPLRCDRVDLPATLLPGQADRFHLMLAAVDDRGRPLPPGEYVVGVGLVQEAVGSFRAAASISITVTA